MAYSILIPNYNGADLLDEFLPSVLEAAQSGPDEFELLVVDDGSVDRSLELLRTKFPQADVHGTGRNVGFGEAVNLGMSRCRHPVVILLNNDVRIERDFFPPLLRHFEDEKVFAVVARGLIVQDGIVMNESVTRLEFESGFLNLVQPGIADPEKKFDKVCTVAHACGGYSAFDREKFIALGGFDKLYYPFYWEDVDLSYRAWKRGWRVLYEPGSVAHHRCHATIGKETKRTDIQILFERNRLLFTWKNLSNDGMLLEHAHAVNRHIIEADPSFKQGFYEALNKIEDVLRRRIEGFTNDILSDDAVLSISSNIAG